MSKPLCNLHEGLQTALLWSWSLDCFIKHSSRSKRLYGVQVSYPHRSCGMKLLHAQIHVITNVVLGRDLWGGRGGHEDEASLHQGLTASVGRHFLPLPPCEDSMCSLHKSGSLSRSHRAPSIEFPNSITIRSESLLFMHSYPVVFCHGSKMN